MNPFIPTRLTDATLAAATAQASDAAVLPAVRPDPVTPTADAQLRQRTIEAAVKFEGLFVSEMLKQMRRGSAPLAGPDALFKASEDNPLLAMADTLVADAMAGQRAFGIADAILRQLLPGDSGRAQPPAVHTAAASFKPPTAAVALPFQQPGLDTASSDPLPAGSPQRP